LGIGLNGLIFRLAARNLRRRLQSGFKKIWQPSDFT
jgi:hypothetical protein